jgi:ankyrin repeat protein
MSSIHISYTDHFTGKSASLLLGADGNPLSPEEQRAHIKRPLELVKAAAWFFAQRSPVTGSKRNRQASLPPLGFMRAEHSPLVALRVMFGVVATLGPLLTTAPRNVCNTGRTAWRWAGYVIDRVTRGHVKNVQLTLADFRAAAAARVAGQPSIFTAAQGGDGSLVFYHLAADAYCLDDEDDVQRTALHWSANNGHLDICRLLLQCNADMEAKDNNRCTPLHLSCYNGHSDVCHLLLQFKANVEAKGRDYRDIFTPLLLCAKYDRLEMCRLLLQYNADVEAKGSYLYSSLHWSVSSGTLDMCHLLLQYKANVNAKNFRQCTPLHFAATRNLELCRLLLQCNADIQAKDEAQFTPLHCAAHSGKLHICSLLVESKADVAARTSDGTTALGFAINYKQTDVAAYLGSIGAPQ